MRIVWLASYPKSGNTWLRFFLYSYLVGPVPSTSEIGRRIPDAHIRGQIDAAEPIDGRLLVKTHHVWSAAHLRRADTEGFVYVLRNPKDTMLSNLNYRRLTASSPESLASVDDQSYALQFLRGRGDPYWLAKGFGTWSQHAESWLSDAQTPGVLVRYEDLKADPAREFRRVLEFLGTPIDEDRLAAAVRASSFDQMRAMEIRAKRGVSADIVFNGSSRWMQKGLFFMNRGQAGQSLASIHPGLDEAYDRAFREELRRFGYRDQADAAGGQR